jgi:hypothetical protein
MAGNVPLEGGSPCADLSPSSYRSFSSSQAVFDTGCIHLLQPETYEAPERSERLQSDDLGNELVRGLSEESFRRFYTRTREWTDPGRPSIQET